MTRRVRLLAGAATAVILVVAIVVFVVVRGASGPDHVRKVLAAAVDPTQNPCVVTDTDQRPGAFDRIPVGFARLAVERAVIICNDVGPDTDYFRFAGHAALESALRRYPSVLGQELCALNHEVFTGDDMDFASPPPGPFRSTCRRLGGHVLGAAPRATAYPCRLEVRAPTLGRANLRDGLLARGRVLCRTRVRGGVSLFIDGEAGPPGSGEDDGVALFRPGKLYGYHMVAPCTGDHGATRVRVYSWMVLTTTFLNGPITPSSLAPGRMLAAAAYSRRVKPAC